MPKHAVALLSVLAAAVLYPSAHGQPPTGTVSLRLTYNVTPDPSWQAGRQVLLSADARRNPAIGQEDIFARAQFPGTYPRTAGQQFTFDVPNVRVGEKIIVQGYMCSAETVDCYPSDKDNPPSCSVEVHVLGNLRTSCEPVFTYTGGSADGGVLCRAECRK
jgi:hypothetical protein